MKCELIRFQTKDKLELHGLLSEPSASSTKAIVHVHGWCGNCYENLFIESISSAVVEKNIAFFSFNNRGAGVVTEFKKGDKKVSIGGCLEIFEECIQDIEAAIDFLEQKGYTEIILQGHSLGCQKISYYMSNKKDKRVKAIVLLAPVNDVDFVQKLIPDKEKFEESIKIAHDMVKKGKAQDSVPDWMQFYPQLSANMFLQIADSNSASGRMFDYTGKLDEIKKIDVPILAIFGSKDNFQPDTEKKLDILKKQTKCETILIENVDHWFAGNEKELANSISEWVLVKA